jgi:hypothetical protein
MNLDEIQRLREATERVANAPFRVSSQPAIQDWVVLVCRTMPDLLDAVEEREHLMMAYNQASAVINTYVKERDALATEVARLRTLITGFMDEHFNDEGEAECLCQYCSSFYEVQAALATWQEANDAEAVTIEEYIRGFRGWRYRWWDYSAERPFPEWMNP